MPELPSDTRLIAGAELLGPDGLDAARCAAEGAMSLSAVAGPGRRLVSLTLDLARTPQRHDRIEISAHLDKRTRSLSFVRLEARTAATLVFSMTAIYATRSEAGDERTDHAGATAGGDRA